jgi:DNA topoisomerase IA
MSKKNKKQSIIWASGHLLGEHFPKDFDTWPDEKLEQFCEDHVWEPLEGSNGEWIVEQIYDLAWSVREYIDVQKK